MKKIFFLKERLAIKERKDKKKLKRPKSKRKEKKKTSKERLWITILKVRLRRISFC